MTNSVPGMTVCSLKCPESTASHLLHLLSSHYLDVLSAFLSIHTWSSLCRPFSTADTSSCRSGKGSGGICNVTNGCIPFRWACSTAQVLLTAHSLDMTLNKIEPSLTSSVTPVLFLPWQVKMSGAKRDTKSWTKNEKVKQLNWILES